LIKNFYLYNQKNRLDEIVERVLKILEKNEDTIIISHSFGGVLAAVSFLKNKKEGRKNIKKIITMGSPHGENFFPVVKIKKYLGYDVENIDPDIFKTFGGFFDMAVPNRYSKIKNSKHRILVCSHNGFLYNKKIIEEVSKEINFDSTHGK
jgi:pimeloyl-ACP methyl ester carboxylesterase